ncbi:MAG: hypothetical protein ACLFR1_05260 [Spirochaetia bacterium]
MVFKRCAAVFIFLLLITTLFAQEVSERQEVAVFSVSHYGYDVKGGSSFVDRINARILDVFEGLGRFDIIGSNYAISQSDVNAFIEQIREVREQDVELPEEVLLGHETFTEADFNALVGSFIVVVPSLIHFNSAWNSDLEAYEAELELEFTFINVQDIETVGHILLEESATGDSEQEATENVVNSFQNELQYEVRSLEPFRLRTGIVEVLASGQVIMQFGRDMGVNVGDEYVISETRILNSGHQMSGETGLVMITEVSDQVSVGRVLYSQGRPEIGAQLEEVPRLGFETIPYAHMIIPGVIPDNSGFMLGFRTNYIGGGFIDFKPMVGFEVPLTSGFNNIHGIPANVYAGAEYDFLNLGRLQMNAIGHVTVGGLIPLDSSSSDSKKTSESDESFYLSHVGFAAQAGINYLFSRDFRFSVEAGYVFMIAAASEYVASSYQGLYGGVGISYRY